MSDDLDFNIKMGNDNDRTRLSSNAQSSSSGYKMSNQSSKSGYQAPTSQNDPESSHNNIEENLSLFDIRQAGHPMACLFTFLFKVLGMVSYLFMGTTTLVFITVVLAAAADFWTVKNITGRLLVGLRWWSDIQQDGTEKWHFESHDQRVKLHPIDRRVFWWSQTVACIFWAVIVLLKILGLSLYWGTCAGICLTLSVVNYWGYYKCSKDHQKKLNTLFRNTALSGLRRGLGF